AGRKLCCSPPIIHYQGDVVAGAFGNEPIGQGDVTSLLYVNYKMPDYTGHVYNFLRPEEARAIRHVDLELQRLVGILESRLKPGAIEEGRMNRSEFAAVFSTDYIGSVTDADVRRAGSGDYPDADPGIPSVIW